MPSSRCTLRSTATSSSISVGRSPAIISSSNSKDGRVATARATSSRRRSASVRCAAITDALLGEAQAFEHGAGTGARAGDGPFAVKRADDRVVEHGQLRERFDQLEGTGDARRADPVRRQTADRAPAEADLAVVRSMDAGDQVEEGGLARAVRSDERADRVALDGKGGARDRAQAAKRLAHVLDLEQRHVRASSGRSRARARAAARRRSACRS